MKQKHETMLPIDPLEFMLIHDGMVISQEFENEVKRDGNKFTEIFEDGVDLFSMLQSNLIIPVGRCPKTKELIYTATEKGKQHVANQKELQEKKFTMGLAKRISNKIKAMAGL